MKVVVINDQLNPGGAEKVIVNTANLLYKQGVDVSILLYLGRSVLDSQISNGIPVFYLNRKGRFDIKAMLALKKHVKKADIIHVHSRYNLRFLIVCKWLVGIGRAKIVFQEHIPILHLDVFTKKCIRQSSAYVAVLQSMCGWMQKQHLLSNDKIFYLPNVVKDPELPENRHQYSSGRVVMVGNFMHLKNQQFAVELINYLGPSYSLDIYGMVHEKKYYDELIALVRRLDLQDRVRLIEGVTHIYDVLSQYELALHTSTQETGPLVLLEYMNAGIPFITYATGDVADNLVKEIPELVMQNFNLPDWKDRIEKIVTNTGKRNGLQCRMNDFVKNNYTEEKYWNRLSHVYKTVFQPK